MTRPSLGDRILIFREPWLSMVLDGRKAMEIRSRALTGKYYIGMKKRIFGVMTLGNPQFIADSQAFRHLREHHRVSGGLPYKKTFGLRILSVRRIKPIAFKHPPGAVTVVRFCG